MAADGMGLLVVSVLAVAAAVADFYDAVVLTVWLGGLGAAEAVRPAA